MFQSVILRSHCRSDQLFQARSRGRKVVGVSKLLTYCVLGQLSLLPSVGWEMRSSLLATW